MSRHKNSKTIKRARDKKKKKSIPTVPDENSIERAKLLDNLVYPIYVEFWSQILGKQHFKKKGNIEAYKGRNYFVHVLDSIFYRAEFSMLVCKSDEDNGNPLDFFKNLKLFRMKHTNIHKKKFTSDMKKNVMYYTFYHPFHSQYIRVKDNKKKDTNITSEDFAYLIYYYLLMLGRSAIGEKITEIEHQEFHIDTIQKICRKKNIINNNNNNREEEEEGEEEENMTAKRGKIKNWIEVLCESEEGFRFFREENGSMIKWKKSEKKRKLDEAITTKRVKNKNKNKKKNKVKSIVTRKDFYDRIDELSETLGFSYEGKLEDEEFKKKVLEKLCRCFTGYKEIKKINKKGKYEYLNLKCKSKKRNRKGYDGYSISDFFEFCRNSLKYRKERMDYKDIPWKYKVETMKKIHSLFPGLLDYLLELSEHELIIKRRIQKKNEFPENWRDMLTTYVKHSNKTIFYDKQLKDERDLVKFVDDVQNSTSRNRKEEIEWLWMKEDKSTRFWLDDINSFWEEDEIQGMGKNRLIFER